MLESRGVNGSWAAFFLSLSGLIVSVPLLIWSPLSNLKWQHVAGAMGIGTAITLYAVAITYSDIVRVVLLFYLAPAWSTLIECVFFGRRWSWRNLLGLGLSFMGIVVIFRGESPLEGLGAVGDWMAVLAGIGWSAGAAFMFSAQRISVTGMASISFVGAVIVAVICLALFGTAHDTLAVDLATDGMTLAALLVLAGLIYVAPVTFITLWGSTQIPPAMMSFLLTLEVIAAVASSALFYNAQFGLFEFLGTLLIIGGALMEVFRVQT